MRVALDMHHTRQSDAGTARYARGLSRALQQRADVSVEEIGGGPLLARGLRQKILTAEQDFFWYPYGGRRKAVELDADVYHCPAVRAPLTRGRPPLVVTIHDLVAVRFPETMPRWTRFYSRRTLARMLNAADLFITPSADTANDLQLLCNIGSDRIRVVWNGVDDAFFQDVPPVESSSHPYVLFVGTPEPRKNLRRLINAVDILRKRGSGLRLLIAGGRGWGNSEVSGSHVQYLGKQSDEQLRHLYSGAACVAQVSLHEGFGLPVIEAMASGAPVVTSREGALPEVTGNAGVLVDAYDETSIADGIVTAISDGSRLRELGKSRAQLFTWARCAAGHFEAYRQLL